MHLSRGCPSELRYGIKIDADPTEQAQSRDIATLQFGQLGEQSGQGPDQTADIRGRDSFSAKYHADVRVLNKGGILLRSPVLLAALGVACFAVLASESRGCVDL